MAAQASSPTAHFVALRPPCPIRQTHYAQVFSQKPALFWKLSAGLGSTNKSAISLFFSYSRTLALFSPLSFFLPQTLWQLWQKLSSLSSCTIRLQWVLGHSFLTGNNTADELTRRGALLVLSGIPCSFFPLVSTLLFFQTGDVQSHLNFSTHTSSRFPLSDLCFLVTFTLFSLVFAAADTALR